MEPVDLTTIDKSGFDCVDKQEDLTTSIAYAFTSVSL